MPTGRDGSRVAVGSPRASPDRGALLKAAELAVRLVLGGVFLAAAVGKLADPTSFVENVANYQLFPERSPWVAATIPALEVVASGVLVFASRPWRQAAALVLGVLLLTFSVAIARAWALGIDTECGCFGSGSSGIGAGSLVRNAALLAGAAFLVFVDRFQRVSRVPPPLAG